MGPTAAGDHPLVAPWRRHRLGDWLATCVLLHKHRVLACSTHVHYSCPASSTLCCLPPPKPRCPGWRHCLAGCLRMHAVLFRAASLTGVWGCPGRQAPQMEIPCPDALGWLCWGSVCKGRGQVCRRLSSLHSPVLFRGVCAFASSLRKGCSMTYKR